MKIFAIGMNYAAHNQELHGTLKRPDEPVIFTKADSALLKPGRPFFVPDDMGYYTSYRLRRLYYLREPLLNDRYSL